MLSDQQIIFVTGNAHKFAYITNGIGPDTGYEFSMRKPENGIEIQSISIREVAIHKALAAFHEFGMPVLVHDVGMKLHELNGFPGAYFKDFVLTIAPETLHRMFQNFENKQVSFEDWLIYVDSDGQIHEFMHDTADILCLGTTLGKTQDTNPMNRHLAFSATPDLPASDDPVFMQHYDRTLLDHGITPCWTAFRHFITGLK